ncbi:hypothetical protein Tdes44962_MAKER03977 [Teratosphaeria destructans]|uniref:Uncharacterized protein n=1 Tax=Teratosphaeria destructans TaxID=418781 RepID=A0A9W7SNC5_9PEZI|nr:hypothetical protein Tdes44962_MAKER03977 [Teratosphaeria destructans]
MATVGSKNDINLSKKFGALGRVVRSDGVGTGLGLSRSADLHSSGHPPRFVTQAFPESHGNLLHAEKVARGRQEPLPRRLRVHHRSKVQIGDISGVHDPKGQIRHRGHLPIHASHDELDTRGIIPRQDRAIDAHGVHGGQFDPAFVPDELPRGSLGEGLALGIGGHRRCRVVEDRPVFFRELRLLRIRMTVPDRRVLPCEIQQMHDRNDGNHLRSK